MTLLQQLKQTNSKIGQLLSSQLYKKASRSLFLKIIGTLGGFLFYLLISRQYGPEGMGIFSLFNTILGLLGVLCCLGLTSATMRFVPQIMVSSIPGDLYHLRKIQFISCGSMALICSILLFVFSEQISDLLFHDKKSVFIIYLIAIVLPLYALYLIGIEFLRALNFIALFEYFRSTHIQVSGLLFLAILGSFYSTEVLPIYITTGLYAIAFIIVWIKVQNYLKSKSYPVSQTSLISLKQTLSISFPMLLTAFSALLMERLDTLMLAYFHNNHEVGLYSIAFKLASLMMFLIIPFNSVLVPRISHAYWNQQFSILKGLIKRGAQFMFWSAIICFAVICFFSELILSLFGTDFINAQNALIFLSIGFFFNALHGMGEHLLNISGNEKLLSRIFSFGLLLNIILNYLLIPKYGAEGAAFASMCSMALWNFLVGFAVKQNMEFSIIYIPLISRHFKSRQSHANHS